LRGLSTTTNRTFNKNGMETNYHRNPAATGPQRTGQTHVRQGRDFAGRRLDLRANFQTTKGGTISRSKKQTKNAAARALEQMIEAPNVVEWLCGFHIGGWP